MALERKWLHVYNSIVRLKFYMYLEITNDPILEVLDRRFAAFVSQYLDTHEEGLRFFGGNTLMAFAYLVLVRINEVLNSELSREEVERLFSDLEWEIVEVDGFRSLQAKYDIHVTALAGGSHKGKAYYTNEDVNRGGTIELDCTMPYSGFLNFCGDTGIVVNEAVRKCFLNK